MAISQAIMWGSGSAVGWQHFKCFSFHFLATWKRMWQLHLLCGQAPYFKLLFALDLCLCMVFYRYGYPLSHGCWPEQRSSGHQKCNCSQTQPPAWGEYLLLAEVTSSLDQPGVVSPSNLVPQLCYFCFPTSCFENIQLPWIQLSRTLRC